MKILLTGSTSMQANPESHRRAANFNGLIWEVLRSGGGNEVFWSEPSVHWTRRDLERWDHVFVGATSPLSMGASRAYGALSVIGELWDSSKLTIVVDAPDPDLITRGLRSVTANWGSLTKEFFSHRREYGLAKDPAVNARLRRAIERLSQDLWPRTVVPGLPWSDPKRIAAQLPPGAIGRVQTVNLDHLLLQRYAPERPAEQPSPRRQQWAYERSADDKWLPSLALGLPVVEVPVNHRKETDGEAIRLLRESTGLLVGPVRGEVWWTPKIAMALSQLTPVFTDWHKSSDLGPAWAHLPGTHEALPVDEAHSIAIEQYVSFARAVPKPSASLQELYKAAGVNGRDYYSKRKVS